MCGFAGIVDWKRERTEATLRESIDRMTRTLVHRGPDDHGHFVDASRGVALGHRRLSIVDLSSSGRQPMASSGGRFQLVYNGEIYNHGDLRSELQRQGHEFRGTSDTEVLLTALESWGLDETLRRCNGMFAFAAWDSHEEQLYLVRDRLGIKPLYYAWMGGVLLFASELKAIRHFTGFAAEIDRAALSLFLQHNYVPAPYSIYQDVRKLPAASSLCVNADLAASRPLPTTYWSFPATVREAQANRFGGTDDEAVDALESTLGRAVEMRMRADVPLGAFLSGGIDSTAIVALMHARSDRKVKTFCIGFEEAAFDESAHARAVAEHLLTDHTTLLVTAQQAQDVIPRLPTLYDEPFADSSQIPTFLVSQLARTDVTVSLSGDGGDELFGGYQRYATVASIWNKLRRIPEAVRRFGELSISAADIVPLPSKVRTLGRFLTSSCPSDLYSRFHIHWKRPEDIVVGGSLPVTLFDSRASRRTLHPVEEMMYIDTRTYLPDDILVKLDRASMGVGLEARVPLLDHEVVEFAWTLPGQFRSRGGESKWILRRLVERYVPPAVVTRPKAGFGVPIDSWLRGPLRDWAESLLDERRLRSEGYLRPTQIREKWQEHLLGQRDWHYYLWDVLMFQAWLESVAGVESRL